MHTCGVTPDWSLRTVHAVGFGAVCTIVSAAVHHYGGGLLGPGGLGLAMGLTGVGAFLLGGRERSMRVILPATLLAQYGLHEPFSWSAPAAPRSQDPDLPTMVDFGGLVGMEKTLAFNLSGHVLHSIFWENLSPDGGDRPEGDHSLTPRGAVP
jgi:hypothetical protein